MSPLTMLWIILCLLHGPIGYTGYEPTLAFYSRFGARQGSYRSVRKSRPSNRRFIGDSLGSRAG